MELNFIKEEEEGNWDKFLIENKGSFLQSFEWGNFQEQFSKKVWRAKVTEGKKILLQAQIIKNKVFLKYYFYIPYGPTFNPNNSLEENFKALKYFLEKIQGLAKEEGVIFLRIEPVSPLSEIPEFDFQDSIKRVQPQKTLILGIDKPEKELLMSFRKRTRYNIKLAGEKGVKVKILDRYSDVFYELLKKTKERQAFHSYPEDYYKKLLEIQGNCLKTELLLAEYEGKIIVASVIIFFGERVTSLHTGFDYKYRALKAPYFLRWKTILEGKKRDCREFDMWGIDEKKWPGVTYLKKSFGGWEFEYGPGKEIVFNDKWCKAYRILRKILK